MGQRRDVFAVTEKTMPDGAKKSFWLKVGASFDNKDGSVTLILDAIPLSGKLQIRDADDSRKGQAAPAGEPLTQDSIPF